MAVIDSATGAVLNVIVANQDDPCPYDGATLVAVPDGMAVDNTWSYQGGEWIAPPVSTIPSPWRDRTPSP